MASTKTVSRSTPTGKVFSSSKTPSGATVITIKPSTYRNALDAASPRTASGSPKKS